MSEREARHKLPAAAGESPVHVSPQVAGWEYLDFRVERRSPAGTITGSTADREVCMVFLGGDAEVTAGGRTWSIEGRRDVFAGLPHAVYLPPDSEYRIEARTGLEVGLGSAPAEGKLEPRLIRPEDVKVEMRGGHNVTRQVTHVLDPGDSEHMLCVEVYTPSGNWSSYPPHRHDNQRPPEEVDLDEIYYYRVHPSDGWAVQRLYTDDRSVDELLVVNDRDTVLVREGYHPVSAAPGYDCYYLNFLAGETPLWITYDEPDLAWVRENWEGAPDRLRLPLEGTGRRGTER